MYRRLSSPLAARLALALAGLLLGLGLSEAALRVLYPTLPSLSALAERPDLVQRYTLSKRQRFQDDRSCEVFLKEPRARDTVVAKGDGPARTIWFAGDSMTAAVGVPTGQGWPYRLAESVHEITDGDVVIRDLSLPGVGYCEVLRRVTSDLQFGSPDVVAIGLFGDDLEARALISYEGHLIGLPHTIDHPTVRFFARRSYAANLAWFAASARPEGAVRFIDGPGRAAFQRNMARAVSRIESAGAEPLIVLIEPVGMDRCAPELVANPEHRCSWMRDDLDLMADLLDEIGVKVVDLRGMWADHPSQPIAEERGQALEVHPDAAGHGVLAEGVLRRAAPVLVGHDQAQRVATAE